MLVTPKRKAWLELHEAELIELLRHTTAVMEGVSATAGDEPIHWTEQPDVVVVVEDLADEGVRAGRISHLLGLGTIELVTILRRSGR